MKFEMLLAGTAAALTLMTVMWVASVRRRNITLIDRAWGPMFVAIALAYVVTASSVTARAVIVMILVAIWGLRLSIYLTARDWGHREDWRHGRLREQWGSSTAWRSLVIVFWFQAFAAVCVATPVLAVFRSHQPPLGVLDIIGIIVWSIGFTFEAIGDHQLARFRAARISNERFLATGLRRYTRHPSYFGDALQWWGLGLLGLAAGAWWSLLGPLAMTLVLLRVTGVAVMDAHLKATRGSAYIDYVRRTSSFLPRPPSP